MAMISQVFFCFFVYFEELLFLCLLLTAALLSPASLNYATTKLNPIALI